MDLVECLSGVEGTLGVVPLMVGWGASVEMIGSVVSPTLLPLSTVAGVVTLVIGVTGNIEQPFNWLKESKERVGSLDVFSQISSISVELTGRFDMMRLTATIGS